MRGYPGSKGGEGVWQRIISAMPPHRVYVEPFFGGGAVYQAKRPAEFSILADLDPDVIGAAARGQRPDAAYLVADAIQLLPSLNLAVQDLVYADPPYVHSTRSKLKLYRKEMTDTDHRRLLSVLVNLRCQVMLSGYRSRLYDEALAGWHRTDYIAATRGGPRVESLWCNFEPGKAFHDPRYWGDGYRERERVKKKRDRWVRRFGAMPAGERAIIAEALRIASLAAAIQTASSTAAVCGEDRSPP